MRILGYLAHHPGEDLYQKDLEAHFGLARSTVSGMLGQLEAQELICREAVPGDARLKRVALTQKAWKQHRWIETHSQQLEAKICRNFTREEQAQFRDFLDRVLENLGAPRCKDHNDCSGDCQSSVSSNANRRAPRQ